MNEDQLSIWESLKKRIINSYAILILIFAIISIIPGVGWIPITIIAIINLVNNKKIKELIGSLSFEKLNLEAEQKYQDIKIKENEKENLLKEIEKLNENYIELDEEVLYQSYGVFLPEYYYDLPESYKKAIDNILAEEKDLIKNQKSYKVLGPLTHNGSSSKGKAVQKKAGKLIVRAFNNESNEAISSVTPINFEARKKKILTSYDQLNKLEESSNVKISDEYKQLKLDRLELQLQYKLKLEEEKEKAKEERERIKEEEKLQKEIKAKKEKLELEKKRFNIQLKEYQIALEKASDIETQTKIKSEIEKINANLETINNDEKDLDYRLKNTRAGYVYIISNLGSFGEKTYKIGMTRRLNPEERINELGSASVPFKFDKHALIFSDDAYGLENELHKHFDSKRVNKVNLRKEFFKVDDFDEIKKVISENFDKPVEFITTPEAIEYRETLMIEKSI